MRNGVIMTKIYCMHVWDSQVFKYFIFLNVGNSFSRKTSLQAFMENVSLS